MMGGATAPTEQQEDDRCRRRPDGIYVCAVQPDLRKPDEAIIDAAYRVQQQMASIIQQQAAQHQRDDDDDDNNNGHNNSIVVDLFVLPELCPFGYSDDTFLNHLPTTPARRRVVATVDDSMKRTAIELQTCICYGTIGILDATRSDGGDDDGEIMTPRQKFTIRQVVVDRQGNVIASYDKMYLCDYGACAETRFFQPGDALCTFAVPSRRQHDGDTAMRFGLMICADMRYPLLARALCSAAKTGGVDAILQPAAFARDLSFRTWTSFREARAVENSVYWVAVNYAGDEFGHSSILPPWIDDGNEPRVLGTGCSYLVEFLSRETLQAARATMPFYRTMQREEEMGKQAWTKSS